MVTDDEKKSHWVINTYLMAIQNSETMCDLAARARNEGEQQILDKS